MLSAFLNHFKSLANDLTGLEIAESCTVLKRITIQGSGLKIRDFGESLLRMTLQTLRDFLRTLYAIREILKI